MVFLKQEKLHKSQLKHSKFSLIPVCTINPKESSVRIGMICKGRKNFKALVGLTYKETNVR